GSSSGILCAPQADLVRTAPKRGALVADSDSGAGARRGRLRTEEDHLAIPACALLDMGHRDSSPRYTPCSRPAWLAKIFDARGRRMGRRDRPRTLADCGEQRWIVRCTCRWRNCPTATRWS